jgi:hypothetical protein
VEYGINKALPREQAVIEYGPRIKRAMTYKGLNRLIQGSAADQTKAAMLALKKAGFRLLLQVHDEIAISVDKAEQAREVARIMTEAVSLEVPSRVDGIERIQCVQEKGEPYATSKKSTRKRAFTKRP